MFDTAISYLWYCIFTKNLIYCPLVPQVNQSLIIMIVTISIIVLLIYTTVMNNWRLECTDRGMDSVCSL